MRVHVCAVRMTLHRADVLEAYLNGQDNIQKATVYERTGDVVLTYRGSRKDAAALLAAYRFDNEELEVLVTSHDSRKINQEYQEKMVGLVSGRAFRKVPARAHRGGIYGVALHRLYLEGDPLPAAPQAGSRGAGCAQHHRLPPAGGLQHRRVGDVPADGEQPAGRVDKEKELG